MQVRSILILAIADEMEVNALNFIKCFHSTSNHMYICIYADIYELYIENAM